MKLGASSPSRWVGCQGALSLFFFSRTSYFPHAPDSREESSTPPPPRREASRFLLILHSPFDAHASASIAFPSVPACSLSTKPTTWGHEEKEKEPAPEQARARTESRQKAISDGAGQTPSAAVTPPLPIPNPELEPAQEYELPFAGDSSASQDAGVPAFLAISGRQLSIRTLCPPPGDRWARRERGRWMRHRIRRFPGLATLQCRHDRGARVCVRACVYPRMLKYPHASRAAAHALCSEVVMVVVVVAVVMVVVVVVVVVVAVGRDVVSWLVSLICSISSRVAACSLHCRTRSLGKMVFSRIQHPGWCPLESPSPSLLLHRSLTRYPCLLPHPHTLLRVVLPLHPIADQPTAPTQRQAPTRPAWRIECSST